MLRRVLVVCQTVAMPTAEIITAIAGLRDFPDDAAPVIKTAQRGDRFRLAPESGQNDWFNVVNPATQADYWLTGNALTVVKAETANGSRAAAKGKPRRDKMSAKQRKVTGRARH